MTGYESCGLWHRRLGHVSYRAIKLSIEPSLGLENLKGKKLSEHQMCPSCAIGKSQIIGYPGLIKRADAALKKVNLILKF